MACAALQPLQQWVIRGKLQGLSYHNKAENAAAQCICNLFQLMVPVTLKVSNNVERFSKQALFEGVMSCPKPALVLRCGQARGAIAGSVSC